MKRLFIIVSQNTTKNGSVSVKLQHQSSETTKSPLGDITQKHQRTFYVYLDEVLPPDTKIEIDYDNTNGTATIEGYTFRIVTREETWLDKEDKKVTTTKSYLYPM